MRSKHDLLNGPIITSMLYLMVPTLISGFFQQLYNITDAVILGKYVGESSMAIANGSALQIFGLFTNFSAGIVSGAVITIAIYHGAQDYFKIVGSIKSALVIIITFSLIFTAGTDLFINPILTYLKVPSDIFVQTASYIRLYSIGFVFYCVFQICVGVLRSFGESKAASKLLIYSYIFNIIFDLVFVGLFKLKESGIAVAYIISQILSAYLSLKEVKEICNINYIKEKADISLSKRILAIAIPSSVNNICFSITCILAQSKFNSLGTAVITSFAIYTKIEKVLWILVESVNVSFITIMSQNYGAKKYDRVRKSIVYGMIFSSIFCLSCTIAFLSFNRSLCSLFSNDDVVIEITMDMIKLMAYWFIVYPAIDIFSSFLNCVNHSTVSSTIMIGTIIGFRIVYLFTVLAKEFDYKTITLMFPYSWALCTVTYLIYYFVIRKKVYSK